MLFIPALFRCEPAIAESVNAFGISFSVDDLSSVDGESVKVSVFGSTRIVRKDHIGAYVVGLYLHQDAVQELIPYAHLQKLVQGALADGKLEIATQGLLRLLRNYPEADAPSESSPSNATQFIESLVPMEDSVDLFKGCLLTVSFDSLGREHTPLSTEHVVNLLYQVALRDLPWVRTRVPRGIFLFAGEFKRILSTKFVEAVHAEQSERLNQILAVGQEFFGENDELIQRLRVLISRIEQIRDGGPADVVSLEAFIQVCKADPFSEQALCPVINQYIFRKAEQALASGNAEEAVLFLARIDLEKRTPRVHEVVIRAVRALPESAGAVLKDVRVDVFLQAMAKVDGNLKDVYLDFLERQGGYVYRHGEAADFEKISAALIRLRADPNPANDEMRVKQAIMYLGEGMRSLAIYTLSKVQTGLSIMQRFRLSLAGLYVNRWVAYLLFIVLVSLTGWYLQFEFRRLRAARLAALERGAALDGGEFHFGPIDVDELERRQREGELHPDLMEYEKLLSQLGLGIKASVKDIKTTYRNRVKTLHPDLTHNTGIETSSAFIELTRAYDRIFDLRKLLGLVDD